MRRHYKYQQHLENKTSRIQSSDRREEKEIADRQQAIIEEAEMSGCQGKQEWPELVGESGTKAAEKIERQNDLVRTIILPEGSGTTKDFRCDRVWVFVNAAGVVVRPPRVG